MTPALKNNYVYYTFLNDMKPFFTKYQIKPSLIKSLFKNTPVLEVS